MAAATTGAVAKLWWKKIKQGTVLYTECPAVLQPQVKILAKADVVNEVIDAEKYAELIGEPYEEEQALALHMGGWFI